MNDWMMILAFAFHESCLRRQCGKFMWDMDAYIAPGVQIIGWTGESIWYGGIYMFLIRQQDGCPEKEGKK